MSNENDSWFKNAFGIDLGKAVDKIKDEVSGPASTVSQVAGKVQGAVEQSPAAGGAGSFPLGGSVGRGGKNAASDVRAVQSALGVPADGDCGPKTIGAIEAYQRKLGHAKPDGRVDAGGATERALAGSGAKPSVPDQPRSSGQATGKRQHKPFSPGAVLDPNSPNDEANDASRFVEQLQDLGGRIVDGALDMVPDVIPIADLAAAGAVDKSAQGLADRIIAKITSGADIGHDLDVLDQINMRTLLDVVDLIKRAGQLEALADRTTSDHERVGVATRTIKPEFDALWQQLVSRLNAADRKAVLERTPAKVQAELGLAPTAPKGKSEEEEGGGSSSGSISGGADGVSVAAALEFKSKAFGSLGKTEFAVTLDPEAKLSAFDVDMTLIRKKIEMLGKPLGEVFDLEAGLSLNAATELSQEDTRVIFEGAKVGVKVEIEARFRRIPVLRKVRFKLGTIASSKAPNLTWSVVIPIPGS